MGDTRRIALFITSNSPLAEGHLRGIHAYASNQAKGNWTFVLSSKHADSVVRSLEGSFDGIIAAASDHRFVQALRACHLPCVNISSSVANSPLPTIVCDDAAIGQLAAQHFLRRGYRNFGFVCSWRGAFSSRRLKSFHQDVERFGYTVLVYRPKRGAAWGTLHAAMARWVRQLPKPAAVAAANDSLASQVLEACHGLGLSVPDEVAVLGVNNNWRVCRFSHPPLSSIAQPAARIGFEAAALLAKLMAGHPPPMTPILIPPAGVITRRSSEAMLADDPVVAEALRFIREHACDAIRVGDVASAVSTPRRSLEQRFRHGFGWPPHHEIRRVQMETAKRLLVETNWPMEKVARVSGLVDAKEIHRVFRRELGVPPGRYRKRFFD